MNEKSCQYDRVLTYLSGGQFAEFIGVMKFWNNEQLSEFLINNMKMHSILKMPDFSAFWDERRSQLRIPSSPTFRFMAQPGILNADLVIGYLMFLFELKSRNQDKPLEGEPYDVLSFHQTRKRLHEVYLLIPQLNTVDLEQLAKTLYNLERFAKQHGCPGYLLLANAYMQLALGFKRKNNEEQCELSFKLCWKFLHLGALSEKDSRESINNAYFGEGIILSNPFNLATIAELTTYCRKAAGDVLPLSSQDGAEQAAKLIYKQQIKNKKEAEEPVSKLRI